MGVGIYLKTEVCCKNERLCVRKKIVVWGKREKWWWLRENEARRVGV